MASDRAAQERPRGRPGAAGLACRCGAGRLCGRHSPQPGHAHAVRRDDPLAQSAAGCAAGAHGAALCGYAGAGGCAVTGLSAGRRHAGAVSDAGRGGGDDSHVGVDRHFYSVPHTLAPAHRGPPERRRGQMLHKGHAPPRSLARASAAASRRSLRICRTRAAGTASGRRATVTTHGKACGQNLRGSQLLTWTMLAQAGGRGLASSTVRTRHGGAAM